MTDSERPSAVGSGLYLTSLGLCLLTALLILWVPGPTIGALETFTRTVFDHATPFFLLSVSGFLLLCVVLALSPAGRRRLGAEDSRPEFSTISWLSMLFAAGMGTGLVVWGVAEPMTHLLKPPVGPPGQDQALAFLLTPFPP